MIYTWPPNDDWWRRHIECFSVLHCLLIMWQRLSKCPFFSDQKPIDAFSVTKTLLRSTAFSTAKTCIQSLRYFWLLQVSGPWVRCRYCQQFSAMSFDPVLSLLLFRIPWGPDLSRLATLTAFCQKGTISLWQVSQRILSTDYCIITMHFNKGLEMNTGFAVIETPLMRVRLYRKLGLWRLNVKNHINMIFDIYWESHMLVDRGSS